MPEVATKSMLVKKGFAAAAALASFQCPDFRPKLVRPVYLADQTVAHFVADASCGCGPASFC
jgi:hypothetical protein